MEACKQYGYKSWKRIASHLNGKTEVQCLHRWSKVLNPDLTKGPWSPEVIFVTFSSFFHLLN
jgi:myb proto-oncogene protein